MKTVLNWDAFATSGQICLSTDTFSVISALIRGLEVETVSTVAKGVEDFVSPSVPSHCFLTYLKDDLIRGIEMTWPKDNENHFIPTGGINILEMGEKSANILQDHIVMLARPPFLDDYEEAALNWIKDKEKYCRDKYGIMNLFAYMGIGNNVPHEQVCAQFTKNYLKDMQSIVSRTPSYVYTLPDKWTKENKVSPEDQKEWFIANKWDIPFLKQVPDDYDPHKEVEAPEEN